MHEENNADNPVGYPDTVVEPPQKLAPVAAANRVASVDVLRGFALLGILVINIVAFALPMATYFNPTLAGGFEGLDLLAFEGSYVLFFQKMMAIFSMLFGAGLILMHNRAEESGRKKFAGVYYRRILWLFIIGMLHAYLMWYGDILVSYALCGLLLYPMRRLSPRVLIILSVVVFVIGIGIQVGAGWFFNFARENAKAAETAIAAGEEPTEVQEQMRQIWPNMKMGFEPSEKRLDAEREAMRGSYTDMISHRALEVLGMQIQAFLFMIFWRAFGLMLLGMALMKLGVFSAIRSMRFYITLAAVGYVVGFSLTGYGLSDMLAHDFDFVHFFFSGGIFDYVGSIFVSLGHVSVLMIIFKSGALQWLTNRLAAVGRMALTNYLMQSILMQFVFMGWGLGLFDKVNRFPLLGFVLGVWILQLIISPIWVRHFQFGPAEWLWRTLTYLRGQPMRAVRAE